MQENIFHTYFTLFEAKIEHYLQHFEEKLLGTSVLSAVRSYKARDKTDLELWAFFCAMINFQIDVTNRLIPMLQGLIDYLEKSNQYYIELIQNAHLTQEVFISFSWGEKNKGFSHRFVKIENILNLHEVLKFILQKYGSIGKYIEFLYELAVDENEQFPMQYVLRKFSQTLLKHGNQDLLKGLIPRFFPQLSKTSAMKRLCLYFRWMVRPYPDLNIWSFFEAKHLLPPIDQSIQRVFSRAFDKTLRNNLNFRTVLEIYDVLVQLNPQDPVKYDFMLSRPAIVGYCMKDPQQNRCYLCPLFESCRNADELPRQISMNPLATPHEQELFQRFLELHTIDFEIVETEVQLGQKRADAICKVKKNGWWVIEVEKELNYTAVGQALVYKKLFHDIKGINAQPVIICGKINQDILSACELDAGIQVISL